LLYGLHVYSPLARLLVCALRPIAKAVGHLGEDIEVLTLPQTCSLAHLSGWLDVEPGGIAETEKRGVGSTCWVREFCAWHAVGVGRLGMPGAGVVEKRQLETEDELDSEGSNSGGNGIFG
jgi:hypothetical protein